MFMKTHGFWPPWSIPVVPRSQYIDTVSCTLRIFEPTPDLDKRFARSISFRRACGGPPHGVWSFYSLLRKLFDLGPGFTLAKSQNSRYIVKTIIIDIVAPIDGAMHSSFGQSEEDWEDLEDFEQESYTRWRRGSYDGKRSDNTTIEETLAWYLVGYFGFLIELD